MCTWIVTNNKKVYGKGDQHFFNLLLCESVTTEKAEAVPEGSLSTEIARQIRLSPGNLWCVALAGNYDQMTAERAIKTISKSRVIRTIAIGCEAMICFSREAFEGVGGFRESESLAQTIQDFAEAAKNLRRFAVIELAQSPYSPEAKQELARNSLSAVGPTGTGPYPAADMSFGVGGIIFRPSEVAECNVIEDQSLWENSKAFSLFQTAVHLLNANRNDEALVLLTQLTAVRRDLASDLLFPRSIAEARLGKTMDAIRSLVALIERVPTHSQGRQLLEELRRHVSATPS